MLIVRVCQQFEFRPCCKFSHTDLPGIMDVDEGSMNEKKEREKGMALLVPRFRLKTASIDIKNANKMTDNAPVSVTRSSSGFSEK